MEEVRTLTDEMQPIIPVVPELQVVPDPIKDPLGYDRVFFNQELADLGEQVNVGVPLTDDEVRWASEEMKKGTKGFEAYSSAAHQILRRRDQVRKVASQGRTKLSQF